MVITLSRIEEERILISVAGISATHVGVDVLVAIVVHVAERNTVSLLQVTEAAGSRHILKEGATGIPEHPVWQQRPQIRLARAQVTIQETIIIQVPKIRAHYQHYPVQLR